MQNSYTLSELARFLRETEKQIQKYADQGRIQGRKVHGEWVFAKADVVLWLEQTLNENVNDQAAVSVENVVSQNFSEVEEEFSLLDFLSENAIKIPFAAKTKESVIRGITDFAAEIGNLWVPEEMADAIRKREEMMSTAMDNGVALLHPRQPMPNIIADSFLALGITPRGIPFGGGFHNLTDIFFLICCTNEQTHLRLLARIGRILNQKNFLDQLRELETPRDILELFREAEKPLL